VAESWGNSEAYAKIPLVGQSGQEFDRMLLEAHIDPKSVFKTNVMAAQPQGNESWRFFEEADKKKPLWRGLHPSPWVKTEVERLYGQLRAVKPDLVIAVGNYALWALTDGHVSFDRVPTGLGAAVLAPTGISSWRGSMLLSNCITELPNLKVLPIIHPAAIMRAWYQRAVTVHDLSTRVPLALCGDWQPNPPPTIYAPPTFLQATKVLGNWLIHMASGNLLRLSHDIETARGLITCMGFADGPFASGATALVIPLVQPNPNRTFDSFWSPQEELALTKLITLILSHPNARIEGQNYNYDTQWIERDYSCTPRADFDTMLAHHLLWPGTPKALDYIASLYNHYYRYWKDDNKEWDLRGNWTEHLIYNGEDCLRTFECATVLRKQIVDQHFEDLWEVEKQKNLLALEMMRRGVRIDLSKRGEMAFELSSERSRIYKWLSSIIPQSVVAPYIGASKKSWWESTSQQKILFYDLLGLSGQRNRKTGKPTLDAEALETLKAKNPEYSRIWDALGLSRSISVFFNTFISAELEPDGRLKCSYNTAGTETFRWSSSENAFWRGTNLQNIPKGEEE
jgi:uracil-DNA glycosylase